MRHSTLAFAICHVQDHEVAMGDALLDGKDVQEARATAEAVKAQQS